jgi:PKD repeat protein
MVENTSIDIQSTISNYYWWLNSDLVSQMQIPVFSVQDTGVQELKLKVISSSGCYDVLSKNLPVYPLPISTYTVSEDYTTPNKLVEFVADSIDENNQYLYQFGDGGSQTIPQIHYSYAGPGYYYSQLIVQNQYACSDSSAITIRVVEPLMDLAISNLETFDSGDQKTGVRLRLLNIGNLSIDSITFIIEMSGQTVFEEQYTGEPLTIGETLVYELSSQFLFDVKTSHYLCLTANVDGIYDDVDLENNSTCLSYNVNQSLLKL